MASSDTKKTSSNQIGEKKSDMNEAMNKAIKMVAWNSALNIALKIFFLYSPFINTVTTFYYKSDAFNVRKNLGLQTFLNKLGRAGFSFILPTMIPELLFTILISIQLFVYIRFDKKIKTGFDRTFKRTL